MVAASYSTAYKLTLGSEGGFSDHPRDNGGATNFGIIQLVYDAFRDTHGLTKRSVKLIESGEVGMIYEDQYARPIMFNRLPAGVDYAVFDFAVNSGVSRAGKTLQRIVGVTVDGQIGLRTVAAVREAAARNEEGLIEQISEARQRFVQSLNTFDVFGKGWTKRIDQVEVNAIKLARNDKEFIMPTVTAGKAYLRAA